jgi:hypothetical protein
MNRLILAIAVVFVGSYWCQEVRALQQVRAVFTGTALSNPDGLNQLTQDVSFAGGDSIAGSFTYNVGAAPDIIDGESVLYYVAEPASYELTINCLTYRSIGDFGLFVTNDYSPTPNFTSDSFGVLDGDDPLLNDFNLAGSQILVNGTAINAALNMALTDTTATAFDSFALPASLALSDFSLNSGTISGDNPEGSRFVLQYIVNSFEIQAIVLGDVNLDSAVDFLDITPFISVLSSGGFQDEADVNENGTVDFLDISPFIDLLSAQ